jgi:hypothetical protein
MNINPKFRSREKIQSNLCVFCAFVRHNLFLNVAV